jgi:uncharacterized protein (TIGR03437 family)
MNRFQRKILALVAMGFAFSGVALCDLSSTKTLTGTQSLNLDTGATAASGGDLLWNGSSLTPQGAAKAYILTGVSFDAINETVINAAVPFLGSSAPIPSSSLPTGTVIAVLTNAPHPAKLLVTAISGSSITLQFTTYGVTGGGGGGGGGGPTISRVTNNSSDIPAGFPNSGISQGALFKIVGSGLADDGDANLHDSNAPSGLPKLLNGAKVTVTSGSFSVDVALYYATPTQIDGVLPSNTPTGTATITVTHNGSASSPFTFQVVAGGPGITTYNNGTAVAQDTARPNDPYGGLITFTKSAPLGAVIIIWGSGFGATVDDDVKYTGTPHETSVSYTIYIGGIQASIAYKGRSVYPGVSVFAVTIPQNAPQGCYVPIVAVAGTFVSNTATLPIHAGGGECSDPQFGITGSQLSGLPGTVKSGFLLVVQSTAPGTGVSNNAIGIFQQSSGISAPGGGGIASIGGCIVTQVTTGGSGGTTSGLSAGTITVNGPGGSQATLTGIPQLAGFYAATLPSIPPNGGAYVFNATAGSQVGAFSGVTVNFPNPLMVWTNQNAAATVARSQGLTVNWTGGTPGSYILITGSSTSGTVVGTFVCYAPQSALTFTVPSYITLSMPAGTGTTSVTNSTDLTAFSASGLDFAAAFGSLQFTVNSNFN